MGAGPHKSLGTIGKNATVFVSVSTLALTGLGRVAQAVPTISCLPGNAIVLGQHYACSNGSLQINPDGSVNTAGCLVTLDPPEPGTCTIRNTGAPATQSIIVSFPANSENLGFGASLDDFRMQAVGEPMPAATKTYTSGQLNGTITLNIGATLNFVNAQPAGSYSGDIVLRVVFN